MGRSMDPYIIDSCPSSVWVPESQLLLGLVEGCHRLTSASVAASRRSTQMMMLHLAL